MPCDGLGAVAVADRISEVGTWADGHKQLEPGSKVIPYMIPGFTDAFAFKRLGCTFYGFSPLKLPKDGPSFSEMFHGHDERAPVAGFFWGLNALYRVVCDFCV